MSAQQIPDTVFQYKISKPHFEKGKGPVLAVDQAHHNFHRLDGRFAAFGKLLGGDGYTVQKNEYPFTIKSLQKIDVLVVSNALNERNAGEDWSLPTPSAFSAEEIKALNQWVTNGGHLLLIADHMPMAGAAADLASSFGIQFENTFALDSRKRTIEYFTKVDGTLQSNSVTSATTNHPAVDSVVNFTGSAFKATGKITPLIILDDQYQLVYPDTAWKFHPNTRSVSGKGFYQLALLKYGKGKIIISAEAAMFSAQLAGADKKPMGFNNPAAKNNPQLILNLFEWLNATDQ
ncbi:MAG TPA: DUF4350 domain-containing protein [Bacteroidia bacterium]|jgi:hypothetical protein|nr:DUF4350 domain-containing protein [Bacteroidia bacterium]